MQRGGDPLPTLEVFRAKSAQMQKRTVQDVWGLILTSVPGALVLPAITSGVFVGWLPLSEMSGAEEFSLISQLRLLVSNNRGWYAPPKA